MPRKRIQPDIRVQFGLAVRLRRESLGLSQEALAAMADLHRTYIGDIERGKRNIAIVNLTKLVQALGMTLPGFFSEFSIGEGGPDASRR